ncbi:MAG: hypothetical protein QF492_03630, partial [Candidatus Krumholzibacteria bacterium]|nr:hypothetical protein [Candidatus Krumholzibacteria bacterium]
MVKQEALEWKVFLFARQPWRGFGALLVCLVTLYFIHSLADSPWLTGLSAFVLAASLSSFLLPTHYRLDESHAGSRNLFSRQSRPWTDFRSLSHDGARLKLRTFRHDSRLDHYRGMLLLLDPERRDEIIDFARQKIKEAHNEQ